MRLGLYGGSFDPIHWGHLLPVRQAIATLELDRVLYLPTARPPHKNRWMAPAEARYTMVELALLHEPCCFASPFEMHRRDTSYTVDTLEHFRESQPGARIVLILGADSFAALPTWRRWRRLLTLAELAVLTRPGQVPVAPDLAPELRQALAEKRAHLIANEPVAISSTQIRRTLTRSLAEAERWLPPLVLDYIRKYDLYRQSPEIISSS